MGNINKCYPARVLAVAFDKKHTKAPMKVSCYGYPGSAKIVASSSKASIEGRWDGGSIAGTTLVWNDGSRSTIDIIAPTKFTLRLEHEILVDELLVVALEDDGKLHWSNGDVWQMVKEVPVSVLLPSGRELVVHCDGRDTFLELQDKLQKQHRVPERSYYKIFKGADIMQNADYVLSGGSNFQAVVQEQTTWRCVTPAFRHNLRKEKSKESAIVGQILPGDVIYGTQEGDWVRLHDGLGDSSVYSLIREGERTFLCQDCQAWRVVTDADFHNLRKQKSKNSARVGEKAVGEIIYGIQEGDWVRLANGSGYSLIREGERTFLCQDCQAWRVVTDARAHNLRKEKSKNSAKVGERRFGEIIYGSQEDDWVRLADGSGYSLIREGARIFLEEQAC